MYTKYFDATNVISQCALLFLFFLIQLIIIALLSISLVEWSAMPEFFTISELDQGYGAARP